MCRSRSFILTLPAHPYRGGMFELPPTPPALAAIIAGGGAVAWRQAVTIPTYEPGAPDRYPMYLQDRVYQGSSGAVYPLPVIDSVASEAGSRTWDALHLENEFVRLMVLPQLGGRIHVGYDKLADYDFFYRNGVIKPALVGLTGPWISGGVEFNWPQHHRPATFLPMDSHLEMSPDGSATVWCSDHDPFTRMKGMHGIRLRPGSALIELDVRLHNRTDERKTFLWWANVAAAVHDDYQSFFPTDVHWVADHARRAITAFPVADRPYYGVDYPARPGRDRLDFFRNITVPTSYMVMATADDFFGGYDHRAGAGFVHWADRRIAPGKKQWTWGNAPFGDRWHDHLTDDDGPYIELMAGVFTDNQPDFSFIGPGETKSFSQYWYPYQGIGVVHQATRDAAVHLSATEGGVSVGVAVTTRQAGLRITLQRSGGELLATWTVDAAPGHPFTATVPFEGRLDEVLLSVGDLLDWRPRPPLTTPPPSVAREPQPPHEVASCDELIVIATHLEQYRHPTRSPHAYLEEVLRRDPGDARAHLALAWRGLRSGRYADALRHVDQVLERQRMLNANPPDGESAYLRGLVLARLGRTAEALDSFAKATWNAPLRHAAALEMARIDAAAGRTREALDAIRESLRFDTDDLRARAMLVVLLRRDGHDDDARAALAEARHLDPLDALLRALDGQPPSADPTIVRDTATELGAIGEIEAALALFEAAATMPETDAGSVAALAYYRRAHLGLRAGLDPLPDLHRARSAPVDRAFPHGLDDLDALQAALAVDGSDARAHALLATLLFSLERRQEARESWQRAVDLGDDHPVTLRNLALAHVVVDDDLAGARELYERAIERAPGDARLWYELDQVLKRAGDTVDSRLARIPEHALVRDDLALEYAGLLVDSGRPTEAIALLTSRPFHPWEGGEGRAITVWERACLAAGLPQRADKPPASLGEVRGEATTPTARRADGDIDYFATSLPQFELFPAPGRRESHRTV